jgi:hypothetical protein
MPPSIEAQIKQKRHQLLADGVHDPFELLAAALVRNEELRDQVEMLQAQVSCSRNLAAITNVVPMPAVAARVGAGRRSKAMA